jgi:hypothetical protein
LTQLEIKLSKVLSQIELPKWSIQQNLFLTSGDRSIIPPARDQILGNKPNTITPPARDQLLGNKPNNIIPPA